MGDGEPPEPASPAAPPPADDALLIAALGHAWSWVELRTTHRSQAINFYLISIAFMFAAYVASVNNDENTLAGCIGLIGAVGSLLFWQQDLRLRAVLRAGTGPLRDVQKAFAERLGLPSLEIVRLTRRPGRRQASTSVLVTAMYVSGFTGSMAGAVYGFLR